ncbi:PDR/VanB family oxidoreductase [Vogesella sp. LIG4]|uniref:PDR/VanB family oxidoreductase n=1 Tax=Vogesella sp. LIG4 TaxID=1192162 RepID=UPI00081FC47D|nr:PDR/VanB family oxidoreductase [Vogesella sp. LIG4]SCK11433.1 Ferredoxin-NADP reductase [Vogesella sp. LIG4]
MNSHIAWLAGTVSDITPLARDIKRFTLRLEAGSYPEFASGSHLLLRVGSAADSPVNAYSLLDAGGGSAEIHIAVKREADSRGGSAWLHELAPGSAIHFSTPANLFALQPAARRHVFIAGGIGITPFISHLAAQRAAGGDCQLHYAYRQPDEAAFVDGLAGLPQVTLYDGSRGQRLDVAAVLATLGPDDHVYACGPQRLLDAVQAAGQALQAAGRLHIEQFAPPAAPAGGGAFSVRLVRSGCDIQVAADESILDAIQRQSQVRVESLCREGYCGTCETRLLSGSAEHHDQYLSDGEKQAQDRIMLCVSRAACTRLELDL